MKDKKHAADELRVLAEGLEHCRTTNDVVFALKEIYAVHERTILRDIVR